MTEWTWIAWAGWQIRVPADWRPVAIEDAPRRQCMMIGSASSPIMQVKWTRTPADATAFAAWLPRRLRRTARGMAKSDQPPQSPETTDAAWLKGGSRSLWYGACARASILLEIVVDATAGIHELDLIENSIIPSLRYTAEAEPTRWAVFDVSFTTPPGFALASKRLNVGDMQIEFSGSSGKQLTLRQIYPASIALSRQPLDQWLGPQRISRTARVLRMQEGPHPWHARVNGRDVSGMRYIADHLLRFPLRALKPRHRSAAVLHDTLRDKLLCAELDMPGMPEANLLADVMASMTTAREEAK